MKVYYYITQLEKLYKKSENQTRPRKKKQEIESVKIDTNASCILGICYTVTVLENGIFASCLAVKLVYVSHVV